LVQLAFGYFGVDLGIISFAGVIAKRIVEIWDYVNFEFRKGPSRPHHHLGEIERASNKISKSQIGSILDS
jgi:hypothetical protein